MNDETILTGNVTIELRGADGELKERREVENLVTTVGLGAVLDQLLASPTIGKPTHIGVGTGTTAAAAGDTALQTEIGTRQSMSSKTRSGATVTYVATFAAGNGTGALTEAGILNASSAGDLYQRVVYSVINKGASDSLTVTWTLTAS